jgi:hypothetical protein
MGSGAIPRKCAFVPANGFLGLMPPRLRTKARERSSRRSTQMIGNLAFRSEQIENEAVQENAHSFGALPNACLLRII